MQEATKANPYEYAGDDPINNVDPNGATSFDEKFISCLESTPMLIGAAIATGLGIPGGILAYLPQALAPFIVAGSDLASGLALLGSIGAGIAIAGLIVAGAVIGGCLIAASQGR